MPYEGHVKNGAIVLDEPTDLKEGDKVRIERVGNRESATNKTPLRGTPYRFDDVISPAIPDEDWDSN